MSERGNPESLRIGANMLLAAVFMAFSLGLSHSHAVPPLSGDTNGDGFVDGRDIGLFAAAAVGNNTDPCARFAADLVPDGIVDQEDVDLFVQILIGGFDPAAYAAQQRQFLLGPVPGLTTSWRSLPGSTAVPLGATLQFEVTGVSPETLVSWTGAVETERGITYSRAEFTAETVGDHTVSVAVNAGLPCQWQTSSQLTTIDVAAGDILFTIQPPSVSAINVDGSSSNETRMAYLTGGSIAQLRQLGPDHYRTSIDRTINFAAQTTPAGFEPLAQWTVDGVVTAMSATLLTSFETVGAHSVTAGGASQSATIQLDTYSVAITGWPTTVGDGRQTTLQVVTNPPGAEGDVTWLTATSTGTAGPQVISSGAQVVVRFDDTLAMDAQQGLAQDFGVLADNTLVRQQNSFAPPTAGNSDLLIGPVVGLTSQWHPAPASTSIPLGTRLYLKFNRNSAGGAPEPFRWTGAVYLGETESYALGLCPLTQGGPALVEAQVYREGAWTTMASCALEVIDVAVQDIGAAADVSVQPLLVDENSSNETTMQYYFSSDSIAQLTQIGPGHYRTSVGRELTFSAQMSPAGFDPLMEWRRDGAAINLGPTLAAQIIDSPGNYMFTVGPPAAPEQFQIDTYSVTITSHASVQDIITESQPVTLTAVTNPPGYENDITWLSSTLYGTGTPILGTGPTFTVQFDNTWGPHAEDGLLWQWLGVRVDNTVFNQDQKADPVFVCTELETCTEVIFCRYTVTVDTPAGGCCGTLANSGILCVDCVSSVIVDDRCRTRPGGGVTTWVFVNAAGQPCCSGTYTGNLGTTCAGCGGGTTVTP